MKTFRTIVVILAILSANAAFSQTVDFGALGGSMKAEVIQKKILESPQYVATYDYVFVKDANRPNEKRNSETILQIGKSYNRFCDYNSLRFDSVNDAAANKKIEMLAAFPQMLGYKKKSLFSSDIIIDKGKKEETILDYSTVLNTYQYSEKLPELKWDLVEGDTLIAEMHCQKATTELFGRKYVAWYCPEIELPYGPYKFNGLPGLIFKVTDVERNFDFTLISFRKAQKQDIPMYIKKGNDVIKSNRETVRRIYKNFCANPVSALNGDDMVIISDEVKASVKSRPYNPIELE